MKAIALVAAALALALAGCGDEASVDGATDTTGPKGPTGSVSVTDGGGTDCEPAARKPDFDLDLIVGRKLSEAKRNAADNGYSLRAVYVDGEAKAVTADYDEKRVNVAVRDDTVTQFCSVG